MSSQNEEVKSLTSMSLLILRIALLGVACIVLIGLALVIPPDNPSKTGTTDPSDSTKTMLDTVQVVDGKDVATGLIIDEGFEIVKTTCTACHSAELVTQNRATREGWLSMIRWMQQEQGLWLLGDNEQVILDYLEKNYAPDKQGRRKALEEPEWYVL